MNAQQEAYAGHGQPFAEYNGTSAYFDEATEGWGEAAEIEQRLDLRELGLRAESFVVGAVVGAGLVFWLIVG